MKTQSQPKNARRTDWFEAARFGMFIHWGLYAQAANNWRGRRFYGIAEWLMWRARIPLRDYAGLARQFNPERFNADAWVRTARAAGMRYVIVTAKHHDGFAMYDSQVSDYTVTAATPFRRDPLRKLAGACRRHGLKFGVYYSQTQDWADPDAVGNTWDFKSEAARFDRYLQRKVMPQLHELLTRYGDIGIIWFDTPQTISRRDSAALVKFVHRRQPDCLVTSRVGNGLGDYVCLGDHQLPARPGRKPVEALFTHNDSWGFTDYDYNFRSPAEVVRLLATAASRGANFLFNIGPKADGTFPVASERDLRRVGAWMRRHRESIHGTGPSPIGELPWGVVTARPGRLFLHVLNYPPDRVLRVPDFPARVRAVRLMADGGDLVRRKRTGDLLIDLPAVMPDPFDTVVEVHYAGQLRRQNTPTLLPGFPLVLTPACARPRGRTVHRVIRWQEGFGNWKYADCLEAWRAKSDTAAWTFLSVQTGPCHVELSYRFHPAAAEREGRLSCNGDELFFQPLATGDQPHLWFEHRLGLVHVRTGRNRLSLQPVGPADAFLQLRSVRLVPVD